MLFSNINVIQRCLMYSLIELHQQRLKTDVEYLITVRPDSLWF
jgi:hypothetical protein